MKTNTAGVPCVFFDRDGIVNESPGPGYVERVQDFHLIGAFVEALKLVRAKGYKAVVITNQRCIARGIVSVQTLEQIHMHLAGQLKKHGLTLDALYVCPHNNNECTCRKPHPGMLLQAAAEQQIDLSSSWMIGDHETDVEAGRRGWLPNHTGEPGKRWNRSRFTDQYDGRTAGFATTLPSTSIVS